MVSFKVVFFLSFFLFGTLLNFLKLWVYAFLLNLGISIISFCIFFCTCTLHFLRESDCTHVALMVWERATRMKTEQKIWGNGSNLLVFVQAVPSVLVWGAISGLTGCAHAWRQPGAPRSMLPWPQSYFLLGLALGSVTRRSFLRKTWKIIINMISCYVLFFQVLFLWGFSRLWQYIVRNPHYISPFLFLQ